MLPVTIIDTGQTTIHLSLPEAKVRSWRRPLDLSRALETALLHPEPLVPHIITITTITITTAQERQLLAAVSRITTTHLLLPRLSRSTTPL